MLSCNRENNSTIYHHQHQLLLLLFLLTMARSENTGRASIFFKGFLPFLVEKPPPRLEGYLRALQEEQKKVAAFQRELPFCMQLLNQAIEASKEQLACRIQFSRDQHNHNSSENTNSPKRPFLEEFIPLKKNEETHGSSNGGVEEWIHHKTEECRGEGMVLPIDKSWLSREPLQGEASDSDLKPYFHSPNKREGDSLPFLTINELSSHTTTPDLQITAFSNEDSSFLKRSREGKDIMETSRSAVVNNPQSDRKPRRCWSPELHRQFVNALQQLGGPQVATPKQIRDLMNVEGLTNDEVKSHLQKYRLHTRRPNLTSANTPPQLVLLRGIWVPPHL